MVTLKKGSILLNVLLCIILFSNAFLLAAGPSVNIDKTKPAIKTSELIQAGLERSQKLKALNANIEIARFQTQTNTFPNPELRVRNLSARNIKREFDEVNVGIRVRFPELGERQLKRQDRKVDYFERVVEAWDYQQELLYAICWEIFEVFYWDRMRELGETKVALESKRLDIINNMVQLGQRSIIYLTKAKMRHTESLHDLSVAKQNQYTARQKLAKRCGIDLDQPIITTKYPHEGLEFEEMLNIAYRNRPEFKLKEAELRLAQFQKRYERYRLIPWFNFIEFNYHIEAFSRTDWTELSLGIEFPLFNWNRANIKATSIAVNKRDLQLASVSEQIEEQVRTKFNKYQNLLVDWVNFNCQSDSLINDTKKVIEEANLHQTLLGDEVLELELAIVDLERLKMEKMADLVKATYDLFLVTGFPENFLKSN